MTLGSQISRVAWTCKSLLSIWVCGIGRTFARWQGNKTPFVGVGRLRVSTLHARLIGLSYLDPLFAYTDALWRAWAPLKCKIFLWLAIRRRCWMVDRLQRHGLQNQGACVFCLHSPKTIDHLLVGCAVTAQIWGQFLSQLGLNRFVPIGQVNVVEFWTGMHAQLERKQKKSLDSCIILVAWMIWKERNCRVFKQDHTPLHT